MGTEPTVTCDPRFRAGRALVQTGRADEGAIEIFGTLLEESRNEFGEASVEAAACSYEYGNALFRALARASENENELLDNDDDSKPHVQKLETERLKPSNSDQETKGFESKPEADKEVDDTGNNESDEKDDTNLALELMETSWSILDQYVADGSKGSDGKKSYNEWALEQLPRVLLGIGDVLAALSRHSDSADAYSRAIPYREAALEGLDKDKDLDLKHLKKRRQLVEANVLVAEAILACPENEDVITTETKDLLVKASERVDYARGYYDKARGDLQDTVFLMGKIAASGKNLETEKEDVCFLATLLMGVGTTLAELDEKGALTDADAKPAAKKQKTQ